MSTEPTEPTSEAAFFTTIRSWRIARGDQRVFGGVLSGVGARIGMAPAPARLIFVLLAIFTGGLSLLAYAAAWALLPDSEGRIVIQDFGRGTPNVGALVSIGIIAFIGFFSLDNWGIFNWNSWWNIDGFANMGNGLPRLIGFLAVLVPLAIIGGIVFAIVWSVRHGRQSSPTAQGYARLPDGTIPQAPVASETVAGEAQSPAAPAEPSPDPAPTFAEAAPVAAVAVADPVAQPYAAPAAPAYTPPVYTAPKTTYTPKPRVPGPGKFGYLAALAMIPIAAAVTLYLHSTDQLAVYPGVAAGVIWTAGLGLILVVNALRGRKAGFLGFVSFVALFPIGLSIAYADEIQERWENSSGHWWTWDEIGNQDIGPSYNAEPVYTPEPAFDPSSAFLDYDSVAISGSCYEMLEPGTPDVNGTVRLTAVTADQTVTVTSTDTRLAIPRGTSLNVVATGGTDGAAYANVVWEDRDVSCEIQNVGTPAIQLTDVDAPVLTVQLDDTMTDGYMSLWIEEN